MYPSYVLLLVTKANLINTLEGIWWFPNFRISTFYSECVVIELISWVSFLICWNRKRYTNCIHWLSFKVCHCFPVLYLIKQSWFLLFHQDNYYRVIKSGKDETTQQLTIQIYHIYHINLHLALCPLHIVYAF